jgi:hypothetical protein
MRVILLSLALQLLAASPALANDALRAIDEAHVVGTISDSQRIYYRVAAVKAPHLLPATFRQYVKQGPRTRRSHTSVMVEAFQALDRIEASLQGQLRNLLLPPPDLTYSLDSTALFPIRVSYALPAQQAVAQRVLEVAEIAYQIEVLDWGFWEPLIEPAAGLFRFYVMDAMGAAGYCSPYLENDDTPHNDAYTYIVIDPSLNGVYLDTTVVHEFNHSCQIAMDYGEQVSFMENTASYVEAEIFPEGWLYTVMTFPYFQSQPWRPLEYKKAAGSDYYEYGGALWVHFLAYLYGNEDPRWVRQVWEGTVQNGSINEPDYFDSLDELLGADGGLIEAVKTFSEYRFFVGMDDDGQHLPGAGSWWDSEVWRTATWSTYHLPIRDEGPADNATRPQPNGCNYIVLDLGNELDWPLRFYFRGNLDLSWHVYVMQIDASGLAESTVLSVDASGIGQATMDADGLDRLVMVVCQRGGESYDPDHRAWTPGDYLYSIEYDIPAPTVTAVSPDRLAQGAHGVSLSITGSGFVEHEELTVAISGERVAVTFEEFVSSEELRVSVTVAPDAELGPRDVVVTNPGGSAGFGDGVLTLVTPDEVVDAGPDGGTTTGGSQPGCGCETTGSRRPPLLPLIFGIAFSWLWVRRHRRSGRNTQFIAPAGVSEGG